MDTKFKYNDKVRIIKGFYRGLEGTVNQIYSYEMGWFFNKTKLSQYLFKSNKDVVLESWSKDRLRVEIRYVPLSKEINEENLELIVGDNNENK